MMEPAKSLYKCSKASGGLQRDSHNDQDGSFTVSCHLRHNLITSVHFAS